jgi:hypothetical protein
VPEEFSSEVSPNEACDARASCASWLQLRYARLQHADLVEQLQHDRA